MKKEEKELLFKDLCTRLPYGVKIVIQDTFKYSTVSSEYHVLDVSNFSDIFCFNYKKFDKRMKKAMRERPNDIVIKPYLFPLSSMTEEQLKEIQEIIGNPNEACISVNISGLELWLNSVDTDPTIWLDTIFELQDWLNKNHFDYRGLIPMDLALDATNLIIY